MWIGFIFMGVGIGLVVQGLLDLLLGRETRR